MISPRPSKARMLYLLVEVLAQHEVQSYKYQEGQILITDSQSGTVGWQPEIRGSTHQLRLVVYIIIYWVFLYIPGGWPWDFKRTINSISKTLLFWCCFRIHRKQSNTKSSCFLLMLQKSGDHHHLGCNV